LSVIAIIKNLQILPSLQRRLEPISSVDHA
jgi:hypothetical protein